MAKKTKKVAQTKAEQNAAETLSRTDQFLNKHMKEIIITIVAIILIVLAILGIRHFYLIPQEKKAVDAIHVAEQNFQMKNWAVALEGDSLGNDGFLQVIDDFGSTTTGNLAKAYAGICYYQLGDTESATSYLKKYKVKEEVLGSAINTLVGDTYANMDQANEAANHFKKAAKAANNSAQSPFYLKKAATALESLGKFQESLNLLEQIQNEYPNSVEGQNIEKEIYRIKALIK